MSITRIFLWLFIFGSQALLCISAEMKTLVVPPGSGTRYSETISLAAGDSATVVYGGQNAVHSLLQIQMEELTFDIPSYTSSSVAGTNGTPVIAGPASIRLKFDGLSQLPSIATFSVVRSNSAANVIPANAVVIPEDAGGQYQVILESSTDLLNWAVANPGTYGGTTPKRFFRTRIVKLN